ncbi:MAG: hypothetical protein SangKO_016490 [Sandaracinaceae bacterium]
MRSHSKPSLLPALLVLLPAAASAQQFEEQDGYVVMEMESVPIPSGHEWETRTDIADASGTHYAFTGNGICNGPAGSPLRYTFRVHTGGTYRLHLRAAKTLHCVMGAPHGADNRCDEHDRTCSSLSIPDGNSCPGSNQCIRTDISNDAFVHVEDASGAYVPFAAQPSRTEGQPIKLYGGADRRWAWTGDRSLDIAGGKHDADWELPAGDYTLVVQGRSQMFRIDRILFYDRARGSRSDGEGLGETLFSAPPVEEDAGVAVEEDAGVASGDDAGIPETDAGVLGMEDASRPGADAGAGRVDGGGRAELMGGCAISPSRTPLPLAFLLLALVPLMRRRVR